MLQRPRANVPPFTQRPIHGEGTVRGVMVDVLHVITTHVTPQRIFDALTTTNPCGDNSDELVRVIGWLRDYLKALRKDSTANDG